MKATSTLIAHVGARYVGREELEKVPTPEGTKTWYPVGHATVIDAVGGQLQAAGFGVTSAKYALTRNSARLFATLDLAAPLTEGVTLAVGIRNSLDQSLCLGFCAGSHVGVCDNLAFRADLIVHKKHTRFGQTRFVEAIAQAVQSLQQFKEVEARRIDRLRQDEIADTTAESLMLRAFASRIVSHRILPRVIKEWRTPSFPDFAPRTRWSLFNAFTTALAGRAKTNPQQHARLTMRLTHLLDGNGTANGGTGHAA